MKTITNLPLLSFFIIPLVQSLLLLSHTTANHETPNCSTSIIFTTLGRSNYAFDIYTLPISSGPKTQNATEFQITDGQSVNYNGHFPSSTSSLLSLSKTPSIQSPPSLHLVYITERDGSSSIYLDAIFFDGPDHTRKRSILQIPARVQVPLLSSGHADSRFKVGTISMKDRPSMVGDYLVYVSTHESTGVARTSWAAVYSTQLKTGLTRRLTPYGVADFSPDVSPSGVWTAVASSGERGWMGEEEELETDIYVFRTEDGSGRVKVVEHAGWPSWADDSTLYFHRRGDDGWWGVHRARLFKSEGNNVDSVVTQRVTPPGLHAFTPAASVTNKNFVAVATRRPGSDFRHIELYDVVSKEFTEITRPVSPQAHHYNPFISPDSTRVGYHRCRGGNNGKESNHLLLENIQSPLPDISLFRIDGSFPSFSPDGNRIAFVKLPGLYVVNRDGSGLRQLYPGTAFSTAWDPIRTGVVYSNLGPTFATESTKVDVISINVDDGDGELRFKRLTTGGENNAFPSPSPDGKWIVFRSGRSGHKNLYIMDPVDGEKGGLHRLTDGPWTDTMCNWSPTGDRIAFASDRNNPGSGSFELFTIHPNGTGLKKIVQSGSGGRANHPWFSPNGESIVFTSDYAAVSAEPISNPHHYQPYGDIFTIRLDGSGMTRLTHNSFEDGTPTWGPTFIKPVDVGGPIGGPHCSFDDCHWLSKFPNRIPDLGPEVLAKAQCGM